MATTFQRTYATYQIPVSHYCPNSVFNSLAHYRGDEMTSLLVRVTQASFFEGSDV
jgi:hypothetical protein